MTEMTLTRLRLAEGVWEGLLTAGDGVLPKLRVRHRDELVGEPETTATGSEDTPGWSVKFRLPPERLSDGVQTFVFEDTETGEALAHETLIAGEPCDDDLRAEISLLRAELDLLKRAFRRHCSEA